MASPNDGSPTHPAPASARVLGLPVHDVGVEGAVQAAREAVRGGRRLRLAVTNVNKCWLALRHPELRSFLEEAELVVPETAVVWGARVLGRRDVRPAWGVALMAALLEAAHAGSWSVYLLGARHDVNRAARRAATARWPRLRVVGGHHGYLDACSEGAVRMELERLSPDVLLVAMGSPRQERFIASLHDGYRVALGVGGSFDVLAGLRREAPPWIRGSGFEWLYRSLQDPRLFRRYVVQNPWFVWSVLRERVTGRLPVTRIP